MEETTCCNILPTLLWFMLSISRWLRCVNEEVGIVARLFWDTSSWVNLLPNWKNKEIYDSIKVRLKIFEFQIVKVTRRLFATSGGVRRAKPLFAFLFLARSNYQLCILHREQLEMDFACQIFPQNVFIQYLSGNVS